MHECVEKCRVLNLEEEHLILEFRHGSRRRITNFLQVGSIYCSQRRIIKRVNVDPLHGDDHWWRTTQEDFVTNTVVWRPRSPRWRGIFNHFAGDEPLTVGPASWCIVESVLKESVTTGDLQSRLT